ncbi:MAG: hypothetical protein MUC38_15605 [Cyclobacteriaceae bacterium]|jgi:putative membrane protein|nr:hypothetical protein [Cyclobacteriaceae bacterium]
MAKQFTPEDLERVKQAVREAESKISGEIVPVVVQRSGFYTIANYRGALGLAAITFMTIVVIDRYSIEWAVLDPLLIFLLTVAGGIVGAVAAHYVPAIKRLLLSQEHIDQATRKRAEAAFLEEEVFNTRHRTGILIFISLFEHEVIVMADKGISKVVEQKEWDRMVSQIIEKIRGGKTVDGILVAVKRAGDLLLEKGFHQTADDTNELRDDLRVEE